MPNQLSIPFKKTYETPLKQAARDYIYARFTDTHPDAFKWDMNQWETLRKDGVGGVIRIDRIDPAIRYHAQLVFILTKLPVDIGLEIAYAPVFAPSALPLYLKNLAYERASVLFNLAALYSQLAASEDRSNAEGVKRANTYYQSAAGTLSFLTSSALPAFHNSLQADESIPLDLTESFIKSLEWLMLAQAQECAWQRAVMDNYKNGVIAKLAAKVSSFYDSVTKTIRQASPSIKHIFPSDWIPHCDAKRYHFEAAAQYRKSIDDLEAYRYGHELARLNQAQIIAKKGYDIARRNGVAPAVLQDVKSILDAVQKDIVRAERDNDLIYHQDVPPAPTLPVIAEVSLVESKVPQGLQNPAGVLKDDGVIFGELLAWGAREAVDIYQDRKQDWLKDQVYDRAQELDDKANEILRSLNLPAALEALEKPIGIPPSLLKKAEEVRLADGPTWVDTSIEAVRNLAERNSEILNQALDILDQEASEDEHFRQEKPDIRLPSHEANVELTDKAERYRSILLQAAESDELVRRKWDDWERNIIELTWDKSELEASIPSSTGRSSISTQTQTQSRALRVLLESLDDIMRSRAQLVERARRLQDADDIRPRISKAAAGIEQWKEVTPAMFESDFDSELAKFDKFRQDIEDGQMRQEDLLEAIKARNEAFLQSRRDDPNVKEREHALQSLDLAYHKYMEIRRNLEEGLKFYNDLAGLLVQFKETCKEWVRERQHDAYSVAQSMNNMTLRLRPSAEDDTGFDASIPPSGDSFSYSTPTSPQYKKLQTAMDLPRPDSNEWEAVDLPPGPSLHKTSLRVSKSSRKH